MAAKALAYIRRVDDDDDYNDDYHGNDDDDEDDDDDDACECVDPHCHGIIIIILYYHELTFETCIFLPNTNHCQKVIPVLPRK